MHRSRPATPADLTADFYPAIEPARSGYLKVEHPHRLYWEECGNPNGIPVLFVHGGPGAGSAPFCRRYFDPQIWRIILFDQRGAGRSRPLASVDNNTTWALVDDMESLRQHLGVERWVMFGGSWGSTLSLAYGITHPERCLAFVLRGVFLFRAFEVDWFLNGMGRFFPEAADRFRQFLPEEEREDLLVSYHRRLMDPDPSVHLPAARVWSSYEDHCARLVPRYGEDSDGPGALALARAECHFMINHGFLREGEILENIHRITHLPCHIVQGRYDVVCPPVSARDLHLAWPDSQLSVIADAGHSALEPGIRSALVSSCRVVAKQILAASHRTPFSRIPPLDGDDPPPPKAKRKVATDVLDGDGDGPRGLAAGKAAMAAAFARWR